MVGGGLTGLEIGQFFWRLGVRVTIVEQGEHLFPREDKDVADELLQILRDDGVTVQRVNKGTGYFCEYP